MNPASTILDATRFDLLHFVSLSGPEGKRWVDSYRPLKYLEGWKDQALASLRIGKLETGGQYLTMIEEWLQNNPQIPVSILRVQQRWYYGALAYYHYCTEELDQAESEMDLGFEAVRAAVEEARFLIPLAHHCSDFSTQKARIARRRRRWGEMRRWIGVSRQMIQGLEPYCVLKDGTEITVATVKEFYCSLPLTPAEKEYLSYYLEDETRLGHFERSVYSLYTPVGWVIPYP
jgi:hypothetical protein